MSAMLRSAWPSAAAQDVATPTPRLERHRALGAGGRGRPILLVHGAWHSAWCWRQGFMQRLAASGHDVHAVSLRGHGSSEGRAQLARTSVADYVDDVVVTAMAIGADATLVGHSMGCLVVAKAAAKLRANGGRHRLALLAPLPASGIGSTLPRLIAMDPVGALRANLTLRLSHVVSTRERVKQLFLSDDAADELVDALWRNVQDESMRAYLDTLVLDLRYPHHPGDILVVAGGGDRIFPVRQVRRTAKRFGTEAVVVDGLAHDLMLDAGWERVADLLGAWECSQAKGC